MTCPQRLMRVVAKEGSVWWKATDQTRSLPEHRASCEANRTHWFFLGSPRVISREPGPFAEAHTRFSITAEQEHNKAAAVWQQWTCGATLAPLIIPWYSSNFVLRIWMPRSLYFCVPLRFSVVRFIARFSSDEKTLDFM